MVAWRKSEVLCLQEKTKYKFSHAFGWGRCPTMARRSVSS